MGRPRFPGGHSADTAGKESQAKRPLPSCPATNKFPVEPEMCPARMVLDHQGQAVQTIERDRFVPLQWASRHPECCPALRIGKVQIDSCCPWPLQDQWQRRQACPLDPWAFDADCLAIIVDLHRLITSGSQHYRAAIQSPEAIASRLGRCADDLLDLQALGYDVQLPAQALQAVVGVDQA
jgi:hypothetical protein